MNDDLRGPRRDTSSKATNERQQPHHDSLKPPLFIESDTKISKLSDLAIHHQGIEFKVDRSGIEASTKLVLVDGSCLSQSGHSEEARLDAGFQS